MTCSDRDHSDWWIAANTTQLRRNNRWKNRNVDCRVNRRGKIVCTDSDGHQGKCVRRANGRLDCTDDNGNRNYCRLTGNRNFRNG